jgi:hypothetical protein
MTMNRFRTTAVAVASALALGSFAAAAVPTAFADGQPAPCSIQQTQVDAANAKLDALAAVFAAHPTRKNKRAEKAQAERVAQAANRLAACLAAAPVG